MNTFILVPYYNNIPNVSQSYFTIIDNTLIVSLLDVFGNPTSFLTTQNTSNTTQQNKTTSKDGANEQEKPREEEPVIPNITYPRIGWMFNYPYQPKYADTLPYYDLFPITLILEVRGKSFLGLNFHYL